MQVKILEIRDDGTFIPMLCVDMNSKPYPKNASFTEDELRQSLDAHVVRSYYLYRCGYPNDGRPNIAMTSLGCDGDRCCNDPFFWGGRTRTIAHKHIIENWDKLKDGDVVDVEFILGETKEPKKTERPY